jgi:hypothetical protein
MKLNQSHVILALMAFMGAVPAVACGSKPPPASVNASVGAGSSSSSAPSSSAAPSAWSSAQPSSSAVPTGTQPAWLPTGNPTASGSAPPPASTAPPPAAVDPMQFVSLLLQPLASKWAKDMSPEGQVVVQNLAEGGHHQFLITMQAGRCYTIIAASPPGAIKDVDVTLLAPPFFTIPAGTDGMKDNTAVIGKSPQPTCPISPIPTPYKVDVFAKSGAGVVAVQVYAKNK